MAYSIFKQRVIRSLCFTATLVLSHGPVSHAFDKAEPPKLGVPVAATEAVARDSLVFPDGSGLPPGSGSVNAGATLFIQQCLLCHGPNGRGGSGEELSGGLADLTRDPPDQTIGTYWPHATTLFDFIRRAMPMHIPGSLSDNDSYALTAYLLYENGIIEQDTTLNANTLKKIAMPNRDGFIWIDVNKDGKLQ